MREREREREKELMSDGTILKLTVCPSISAWPLQIGWVNVQLKTQGDSA